MANGNCCCLVVRPIPGCVKLADGTYKSVIIERVYDQSQNGTPVGQMTFDPIAPTTIYAIPTGAVLMVGACPVIPPDVEWEQMCEKLADGTVKYFLRRSITSFDTGVAVVTVTDWELDKVTAYTVADEANVGKCTADCPANTIPADGIITDITQLGGSSGK